MPPGKKQVKKLSASAQDARADDGITSQYQTPSSSGVASQARKRRGAANDAQKQASKRKKREPGSDAATPDSAVSEPDQNARPQSPQHLEAVGTVDQIRDGILTTFVFGNGENCELGLGPKAKSELRPRINPYLGAGELSKFQIVQIACGGMHTVALTAENKVVTWGVNDNDALGRDTTWDDGVRDMDAESDEDDDADLNPYESTPAEICTDHVPDGTRFVQVAAGDSCSFAVTDVGLVFGWGTFLNTRGDEGFGYDATGNLIEKHTTPRQISGLKNISQVACGANHAIALDKDGDIWSWGAKEQNQLGRRFFGPHQDNLRPGLVRVCRGNAKYVACGEYHSFAVDRKGNVWAWGLNSFGETGCGKVDENLPLLPYPMRVSRLRGRGIMALDGGSHHSVAVAADGACFAWGRMDGGQLGIGFTPEQLNDETLLRRDMTDKPRICLYPTKVSNVGKVVHVACGTDHTIFISKEGKAYSTGFGSSGQLGLGSEDDADVAKLIRGKDIKDRVLTWAGAGGQFSVVAGPTSAT